MRATTAAQAILKIVAETSASLHPDQHKICGGWPGAHIGKCPRR